MKNKGYNLIEVLVAMALLAWVVLVVAGLFIYGQKGVYSGKQQTKAVAFGQKIYEDLASLSFENKYKIFQGTAGNSSIKTTYSTDTENPFSESTEPMLFNIFNSWKRGLEGLSPNAYIECTITAKKPKSGVNATFDNCLFLQFDLLVFWTEVKRLRRAELSFTFGGG